MSQLSHAIIWIDHREAKVCRFNRTDQSEVRLTSHPRLQHLHHGRGGWEAGGNPADDGELFRRVEAALDGTAGIVIIGPGNARGALKTFIDNLQPHQPSHVFTEESLVQPSDEALLEQGRRYFRSG